MTIIFIKPVVRYALQVAQFLALVLAVSAVLMLAVGAIWHTFGVLSPIGFELSFNICFWTILLGSFIHDAWDEAKERAVAK